MPIGIANFPARVMNRRRKGLAFVALRAGAFLLILVAASLFPPSPAHSGGILHASPPRVGPEAYAVARATVVVSRTWVTVSDDEMSCRFEQTFLNDNDLPLEGMFLFPLETGGPLLAPQVRVDGIVQRHTVMSHDEFFPLLKELTTTTQDPSLLGLAGKSVLVVRSVHLAPHQQRTIRLDFRRNFSAGKETIALSIPLDGERYAVAPVGDFAIHVRFKLSQTVRGLFSPTHPIEVFRESPARCTVTVHTLSKPVKEDFHLIGGLGGNDLDFTVLTHRRRGERGVFLAMLHPPVLPSLASEQAQKDVVFVLDASGSMTTGKLELAKRVIFLGFESLQPKDRFNVVVVRTRCSRLAPDLLPATPENVSNAAKFVDSLTSQGGTDLFNGLMMALDQFVSRKRTNLVVITGDGRGTIGITDPASIADAIQRHNRYRARLYAVAIGPDAEFSALDKLTSAHRGTLLKVSESVEVLPAVRRLFVDITSPVVSELVLEIEGAPPEEMAPPQHPGFVWD